MVIVIFMLKSRATLCGFFFVVLFYIIKYNNFRIRATIGCLTILIVTYILCDSAAYEVVVEQIIFGNRDASDVNDLSSGRVYLMKQLLPGIYESPWFGSGNKYMDCFPIIMIAQYGIIGASIVFIFLLYVASLISIKFKPRLNYNLATYLLFWAAMINSLFEANPPFGPGIKCFIIWMLFGISLSKFSSYTSYITRT
ncbi:O-antigen ligase family protein [Muribaculum intestinale]